jgi:DNA processing protein
MNSQLRYQIALTLLSGIGPARLRPLLLKLTPEQLFQYPLEYLQSIDEINPRIIDAIRSFDNWKRVDEEIKFIEEHKIDTYFISDEKYPTRLKECADAPLLLYGKGKADLNAKRILAVVGTRLNTDLGKKFTNELIESLQFSNITIVSGLAYGIDSIAHMQALQQQLPTLGVLAHGLDRIYPWVNRNLARQIVEQEGALLTECKQGEKTDTYLFPRRNRIVAGLSDATLVIESAQNGGSLITAELAWSYSRTVFAVPGRPGDQKSSGCLQLIKNQKAQLVTGAHDILYWMGWTNEIEQLNNLENKKNKCKQVRSNDENQILLLLSNQDSLHFEDIQQKTEWPTSKIAEMLLNLSLSGLIVSLPGNRYQLG